MGQKTVSKADRAAFRAHLINYLSMQADTRQASIEVMEAEQRKQAIYERECKQREVVTKFWVELREHAWATFEHFQLPDGRVVHVQQGNIHVCNTTEL